MPKKGEKMSDEQKAKLKATRQKKAANKTVAQSMIFSQNVKHNDVSYSVGDELKANNKEYKVLINFCK